VRGASPGQRRLPAGFPLLETHVHLEGSIPWRVLARLAARAGRPLPRQIGRVRRPLQRGRGFGAFLDAFVFSASLLRSREDVEEAAAALISDLRAEGVRYAEIAFTPQVHARRGLPVGDIVAALGAARLRARQAGGPEVAFIADGGRLWAPGWFEEIVDQIAAVPGAGVVAVGLGGEESAAPARAFRRAFERARKAGFATVAHAGEGTTPRSVLEVIEELGVGRIGHGIAAASDPSLLRLLARRGILLEVCLTSNVLTGSVPSLRRHPLPSILDAGVRVALGSDDQTVFGTTLRGEFALAMREVGVRPQQAAGLLLNAVEGSLAPARLKADLRRRIKAAAAAWIGSAWEGTSRS